MASFSKYQTKSGTKWLFKIETGIDPLTGRRKNTTRRGFKTKREAQEAAYELELEFKQRGNIFKEKDLTFKEFSEEWLEIYENERAVKPGTLRIRKHEINNLLKCFNQIPMKDINLSLFQRSINKLKRNFSESTLEGIYSTATMMFEKAVELEIIKENPTIHSYFPRYRKSIEEIESEDSIPNYMEKEEVALFLRACLESGLKFDFEIFLTLAYTGLRVGEFCALKTSDVFEEDGSYFLNITKTLYNPNNIVKDYTLVTTKNKTSRRVIDIDKAVFDSLQRISSFNELLKKEVGEEYHDRSFIFVNIGKYPGYPLYIKFIQHRMNRMLNLTGLNPNLTPHSLRHTHTSLLSEAEVSLERIMKRLGHANDKITKRIYLHTTKAVRERDAEKFKTLMDNVIKFDDIKLDNLNKNNPF